MRSRAKMKISANVDPMIVSESDKLRKKLGIDTFSKYVEYALRSVIKDPELLIKAEMIRSQREMVFWREILTTVREIKAVDQEERGSPAPLPKEEDKIPGSMYQ